MEFYKSFPRLTVYAPYLFLAGDIGKIGDTHYKDFIDYCSKKWEKVVVVLGNHEFYHAKKDYFVLLKEYQDFFSLYDNVFLLEKEGIMLEDYCVLGCTMWSFIDPSYEPIVNCTKKVKRVIIAEDGTKRTVGMGPHFNNQLHYESKQWLLDAYDPSTKTIIVTHHPITHEHVSQEKWRHEPIERKTTFCTEMNLECTEDQKVICISGHTHYSHDYMRNNVRYISNQMGYRDEAMKQVTLFDVDGVYDLDVFTPNNKNLDDLSLSMT
jgi:hypothetical protein